MLVFLSLNSFGQRKTKFGPPPTEPYQENDSVLIENSKCIHFNNYSLKKRLSFYPFNKANQIILISYNDPNLIENRTPIKDKQIDFNLVKESKILNTSQIDSLTGILYNIGFKSTSSSVITESASCYNPRNSVVFLNSKKEVIDYIEICFQCNRHRFGSEKIKEFDVCSSKYDILKDFFSSNGIEIGTSKEIEQ